MLELPTDFPHESPKKYSYSISHCKGNVYAIWLHHHQTFSYTCDPVRTIWGYWDSKKKQYFAPINSKKPGKVVNIKDTTPYTSMQLNLNPLEHALYARSS